MGRNGYVQEIKESRAWSWPVTST